MNSNFDTLVMKMCNSHMRFAAQVVPNCTQRQNYFALTSQNSVYIAPETLVNDFIDIKCMKQCMCMCCERIDVLVFNFRIMNISSINNTFPFCGDCVVNLNKQVREQHKKQCIFILAFMAKLGMLKEVRILIVLLHDHVILRSRVWLPVNLPKLTKNHTSFTIELFFMPVDCK